MGSKAATAQRNKERAAATEELMSNIMTGGEISKRREAELAKAAAGGRGIQFIPGSPTVTGLTQKGGQPVYRTGATASDYTGRIVSSAPTFGEMLGDMKRALVGGQAEAQPYIYSPTTAPGTESTTFRQFTPQPTEQEGIIPALINTGGITGIVLNAIKGLIPGQREETTPMPSGFTSDRAYFIPPTDLTPRQMTEEPLVGDLERNRLKTLIANDPAPGSQELNVDAMSDREVIMRLGAYDSPFEGYAKGGLIPPESGPMSEGVASLFKNK
jgi:hypothetical protein